MKLNLSKRFAESMAKKEVIDESEKELYAFGLNYGLMTLLNVVTTTFVGIVFGMLWQSLVFMVSYIPLRAYAGGYHSKTPQRCYLTSILMIVTAVLLIKNTEWTSVGSVIAVILTGLCIYVLAPADNKNRSLEKVEKKVFRKRVRLIWLSEFVLITGFFAVGDLVMAKCMIVGSGMAGFMLVIYYPRHLHRSADNQLSHQSKSS